MINGGSFGQRWADLCAHYHLKYSSFNAELGENIDLSELQKAILRIRPNIILAQHNETSSMQLHPIAKIGALCKRYNVKFVVDAISSFAIDEYTMDKWNIYATVLSANKGIGTYPGLAMVVLSKNAILKPSMSYYFDLSKYILNDSDVSLPFTPNIVALKQLNHQLNVFRKRGLRKTIGEIRARAYYFRKLISDLPFTIMAENPSNCGTALFTERTDVKQLFEKLQEKNIYFTPAGGLGGRKLIISHIGDQDLKDVELITKELTSWINR